MKRAILFLSLLIASFAFAACNPQASPSPSPFPSPTLKAELINEQLTEKQLLEQAILQALVKKNNFDPTGLTLTVNQQIDNYATGTVGPSDGGSGGGHFFAVKVEDEWIIAADGNGSIYCSEIAPYDFPKAMIEECWDEETQALKKME